MLRVVAAARRVERQVRAAIAARGRLSPAGERLRKLRHAATAPVTCLLQKIAVLPNRGYRPAGATAATSYLRA